MKWKLVEKQNCYSGFLKIDQYRLVHDLFAGGETAPITREVVALGHAVAVIMYDPSLDNVVLIEQFRIGAKDNDESSWLLELVAGMVDPGESPEDCLVREAKEEAGLTLQRCEKIFHYYSTPGTCSETITLYYGEVDSSAAAGIHGLDHENEDIKVHVFSFEQAMELVACGRINSATPIIGLQWLQLNRGRLRSAG